MFNTQSIKAQNPTNTEANTRSLVYNSTIYSIDNMWYVNHVKNYLASGKFTVDTTKKNYEVRRTPVYPIFYGIHYLLFGEQNSYYFIRFTQTFLLGLAVALLFLAVFNFTGNRKIALLAALLYALQPCIPINAFYTCTESISSELICFFVFALSLCKLKNSKANWLLSGLLFALAALCRPSIVFLAVSCLFAIFYFNKWNFKNSIFAGIFFSIGAAILFLPWTIRNYKVTKGELIFLEKFYGDPMDYGMPNIYLRKWIACWTNPADYASERVSNLMSNNLMHYEPVPKSKLIDSLINAMSTRAFIGNDKATIHGALGSLYEYYRFKNLPEFRHEFDSTNMVVTKNLHALKANFIKKSAFDYYVITPILFAKSVVLQSNSTAIAFLDNYSESYIKKALKALLYFINAFSFFSVFFLIFYQKKYKDIYWISVLFIASTFLVIIYYLQYFENRYNFPVYPFLYTLFAISIYEVCSKIKDRITSKK